MVFRFGEFSATPSKVSDGLSRKLSAAWLHVQDMGAYGVDLGSNIGELLLRLSDALPPQAPLGPLAFPSGTKWIHGGYKL